MRLPPVFFVVVTAASLAAAGAPGARAGGLPVCDGKHRRPANPYGSVLAEGLKPVAAAVPASPPPAAAKSGGEAPEGAAAGPRAQRPGRAVGRAAFAPCGTRRG